MPDIFVPGRSIGWDYLWQSTLFLAMGLFASALLARRSARAHQLLLMAGIAAIVTPLLAQAANRKGWGILSPKARRDTTVRVMIAGDPVDAPTLRAAWPGFVGMREQHSNRERREQPAVEPRTIVSPIADAGGSSPAQLSLRVSADSLRALLLAAWLILTVLSITRLAISALFSVIVVRRARPLGDGQLAHLALESARKLGVEVPPELRSSPSMRCPSIWCWRRQPVILLPENATTTVGWAGVFCHELAHWMRRDHWSGLFAEALVCALPWHPLAWLTRYRLGQLSELACDDWVLATGLPATDYAESLLSLMPQRRAGLALTAASSRHGVFSRVKHILDEQLVSPVLGAWWAFGSAIGVLLVISAVALAQNRPGPTDKQSHESLVDAPAPLASSDDSADARGKIRKRSVTGHVFRPDGTPAAGATVHWLVRRKWTLSVSLGQTLEQQESDGSKFIDVMARTETDRRGAFALSAEFAPHQYEKDKIFDEVLVVAAPAAGLRVERLTKSNSDMTVRLEPELVIHGRLLTPGGQPAAGVRVTLARFDFSPAKAGLRLGMTPTDDAIPHYWPKPEKTDASGRFRWEGLPKGARLTFQFWHPDYAVDKVDVDTAVGGTTSAKSRSPGDMAVGPIFTHVLEPARPVQGQVTDNETGKPLAGMLVVVVPMHRIEAVAFFTRTDSQGRYRVSGYRGEWFGIRVCPPVDSGYLPIYDCQNTWWQAGAKFLEKNFALEKGRIVRGRVIDAESKLPIPHAVVDYEPRSGNPNIRDDYLNQFVSSTDGQGQFTITALTGKGFIAVETQSKDYVRESYKEWHLGIVYPQGLSEIEVTAEKEVRPVEILLRKGVALEARVVDQDGRSVADVMADYQGIDARYIIRADKNAQLLAHGMFRLRGADPNKTYRVFFLQYERRLGAIAELKYDPASNKPVEVRLQPTAQVHGEIVRPDGSPAVSGKVLPLLVFDHSQRQPTVYDLFNRDEAIMTVNLFPDNEGSAFFDRSNLAGAIRFDRLVPGARVAIHIAAGDELEKVVFVPPLKPGEDRDLGTITLSRRQP